MYLRPAGIRQPTFVQWEEELAEYTPQPSKRKDAEGKPLTKLIRLKERWASYEGNRRNKEQSLKRIAILDSDTDALGLGDANTATVALGKDRTLFLSVVNVVDAKKSNATPALLNY